MRKVGLLLGVLLALVLAGAIAYAQQPFSDVPRDHWAYNAVNRLAEQGILEGYPNGTFKGKNTLTRYEFAMAIARMMDRVEAIASQGPAGPPGPPGPAGPPGPPGASAGGLTPEQQALLDRLAKEFAPELRSLRSDLNSLTKRVDALEAAKPAEGPMIKVSGDLNWRVGLYGTELGVEDTKSTGYPWLGAYLEEGGVEPIPVEGSRHGLFYGGLPYGAINLPDYNKVLGLWTDDPAFYGSGRPYYAASIPISDALKDAYKAPDFMSLKTTVNLSGSLSPKTDVMVQVLAGPETNSVGEALLDLPAGSPNAFTGNGLMDRAVINQAWVKHRTKLLTDAEVTVGKQYFKRGVGLLADNSQEAIKAFRVDWGTGDLKWGGLWGMLDLEMFYGRSDNAIAQTIGMYMPVSDLPFGLPQVPGERRESSGQDNYNLYWLDYAISKDWSIGGTWLESGFNKEQGWSANLKGKAYGVELYGEYAQLLDWPTGDDFADWNANGREDAANAETPLSNSDSAWVAGLRWSNPTVAITGEYGQVDAGYAFSVPGHGWTAVPPGLPGSVEMTFNLPLSALHPNAEVDPHDINWVDRPLFLDPTNIARGYHVDVTFPELLGKNTPLSVSYMNGDAYNPRYLSWLYLGGSNSLIPEPDKWVDADSVWIVRLGRQFSENLSANILYGRRDADNVLSSRKVPVGYDSQTKTFVYAENDPVQVIRAELNVAF